MTPKTYMSTSSNTAYTLLQDLTRDTI